MTPSEIIGKIPPTGPSKPWLFPAPLGMQTIRLQKRGCPVTRPLRRKPASARFVATFCASVIVQCRADLAKRCNRVAIPDD